MWAAASLEDMQLGIWLRLVPKQPEALCIVHEGSRLLRLYSLYRECLRRHWGAHRFCLEAQVWGNHSVADANLGPVRAQDCWPSSVALSGGHDGWRDIEVALAAAAHLSFADPTPAIEATFNALNVQIWEVNQLQMEFPHLRTVGSGRGGLPLRLRPALVPMDYPMSLHVSIETSGFARHRGDVVVRLLRDLEASQRSTSGAGLVYVELGVAFGHLAHYVARHAGSVLAQMHLVDLYEVSPMDGVVDVLARLGMQPCGAPAERWPTAAVCGADQLRAVLHKTHSVSAAAAFLEKPVDLLFVDAGHRYEDVLADLQAWVPRVKAGGIVAGHDFRYLVGGVRQAVADFFQGDVFLDSDTVFWAPV